MYYDLTKGKYQKSYLICTADDGGQSDATVLQYCGYTDCRARGWKECTRGGGVPIHMTFLTSIFWDFPWGQESYFPFIKGKTISMRAGSCGACFCAHHGSDGLR